MCSRISIAGLCDSFLLNSDRNDLQRDCVILADLEFPFWAAGVRRSAFLTCVNQYVGGTFRLYADAVRTGKKFSDCCDLGSKQISIEHPVVDGLLQVMDLDQFGLLHVSDRSRDSEDLVVSAGRQAEFIATVAE
jgi:hypothetical protein